MKLEFLRLEFSKTKRIRYEEEQKKKTKEERRSTNPKKNIGRGRQSGVKTIWLEKRKTIRPKKSKMIWLDKNRA